MERTEMPNLRNGSKEGFEPGLTRLRVRHSTTELPRSSYVSRTCSYSYFLSRSSLYSHHPSQHVLSLSISLAITLCVYVFNLSLFPSSYVFLICCRLLQLYAPVLDRQTLQRRHWLISVSSSKSAALHTQHGMLNESPTTSFQKCLQCD